MMVLKRLVRLFDIYSALPCKQCIQGGSANRIALDFGHLINVSDDDCV